MMKSAPCLFERCMFDNACWRPLWPCKHSDGATRATRWSQICTLLATQETLMAPDNGASNNTTDMVFDTMHPAGEARQACPDNTIALNVKRLDKNKMPNLVLAECCEARRRSRLSANTHCSEPTHGEKLYCGHTSSTTGPGLPG